MYRECKKLREWLWPALDKSSPYHCRVIGRSLWSDPATHPLPRQTQCPSVAADQLLSLHCHMGRIRSLIDAIQPATIQLHCYAMGG